ncbi:MAG: serine hydrolase, partial [Clostridia bacterium]|nr:serine hydrolase [Clostridia bacterium]
YNMSTESFNKAFESNGGKLTTLQAMKCPASDPLSFEPGTHWQYSMSHDVLAAVVEIVSGKRFSDYVRDNIFQPLGMNESFYHATPEIAAGMAEQYIFRDSDETDIGKLQTSHVNYFSGGKAVNVGKTRSDGFGPDFDSGGAGIITSVPDYSKLCAALARKGRGANGEVILSPGTVELLRTNQLSPELLQDFNWEHLKGYGYGLGVRTLMDKAASGSTGNVGEFGWGGAAGATVLVDPDMGLSVFYAHHMLNPQETYYQPRLRNVVYACIGR